MSEKRSIILLPEITIEDNYLVVRIPLDLEVIEFVKEELLPCLFQYIEYRLGEIGEGGSA